MNKSRLPDYLDHMRQAATDACAFVEDKRTQQAVTMNLIVIGEDATKGYFDINLDVVWETVQTALPELLRQLPAVR